MIQGTFGQPARIRTEGKDITVSVKYPDAATLDMRGLSEALILTRGGEYLRLGEIAVVRRDAHPRLDRPREPAVPADDHVGVPRPVQGRGALPQGGVRIAPPAAGLLGDARRAVVRDRGGAEADQLRHRRRPGHHLHDPGGPLRVVRPALLHPAGRAALAHRRLRRLRRGQGALRPDGLHRRHPALGDRRQQRRSCSSITST